MRGALTAAICCSILAGICVAVCADDAKTAAPKLKVTWKPSFGEKYVVLSVTNMGDAPVQICTQKIGAIVKSKDPSSKLDPVSNPEEGLVYPVLEFLTDGELGYSLDFGGGGIVPTPREEIKPGETKDLKFSTNARVFRVEELLPEMNCVLILNGKDIHKVEMKKKDGKWSE